MNSKIYNDLLIRKITYIGTIFGIISIAVIIILSMNKTNGISTASQSKFAVNNNVEHVDGTQNKTEILTNTNNGITSGNNLDEVTNVSDFSNESGLSESGASSDSSALLANGENQLLFKQDGTSTEYLCIPLPADVDEKDIAIENHYMDSLLYVVVKSKDRDFYKSHELSGKRDAIVEGSIEQDSLDDVSPDKNTIDKSNSDKDNQNIRLKFKVNDLYEYKTILENNTLYIAFYSPREVYEKILVIDASCGGADDGATSADTSSEITMVSNKENQNSKDNQDSNDSKDNTDNNDTKAGTYSKEDKISVGKASDGGTAEVLKEKDISLELAKKLKAKLDKTDIKVYYTRMSDVNPSSEARIGIANKARADAFISIAVDANTNPSVYGITTCYNDEYFIPGFGNVELADCIEKSVVTAVKGKALGLSKASAEDYILKNANVPAIRLKVGCMTNPQEVVLLGKDDYLERLADGIYEGILNIYR